MLSAAYKYATDARDIYTILNHSESTCILKGKSLLIRHVWHFIFTRLTLIASWNGRDLLFTGFRGGIKIFKALARLASNSKVLLAKSEKNLPKSYLC
jgi:hypothetical protein